MPHQKRSPSTSSKGQDRSRIAADTEHKQKGHPPLAKIEGSSVMANTASATFSSVPSIPTASTSTSAPQIPSFPSLIAGATPGSSDSSTNLKAIVLAFGVQSVIATAIVLGFCALRRSHYSVYQPRSKFAPKRKKPPVLPNTFFGWIRVVIVTDTSNIARQIGYEAVMFLRLLRSLFFFFCILSAFGLPLSAFYSNFSHFTGTKHDIAAVLPALAFNVTRTANGVNATALELAADKKSSSERASSKGGRKSNESAGSKASTSKGSVKSEAKLSGTKKSAGVVSPKPSEPGQKEKPRGPAAALGHSEVVDETDAEKWSNSDEASTADLDSGNASEDANLDEAGSQAQDSALQEDFLDRVDGKRVRRDGFDLNATLSTVLDYRVNTLSINQIDVSSAWYWLPASMAWLITFLVYGMFLLLWRDFISLRRAWFATPEFQQEIHHKTLLLTNVPLKLRSTDRLTSFMRSLGLDPPPVEVVLNRDAQELQILLQDHENVVATLERLLCSFLFDPNNIPVNRPTVTLPNGSKADAIDHYTAQLNSLERRIYSIRATPDVDQRPDWAAFVSFPTAGAAYRALRILNGRTSIDVPMHPVFPEADDFGESNSEKAVFDPSTTWVSPLAKLASEGPAITVKPCPDTRDILWPNLSMSPTERSARRAISVITLAWVILTWTVLAIILGALSDLRALVGRNKAAKKWLRENPAFQVFWMGVLLPGTLTMINTLLPYVLRWFSYMIQGSRSRQSIELSVLWKIFALSVYQLFVMALVGSLVASSSSSSSNDSSMSPEWKIVAEYLYEQKLTLAIAGLASKSNLYMTYLSACLAGWSLEIIQALPLIRLHLQRWWYWAEFKSHTMLSSSTTTVTMTVPQHFQTPRERYLRWKEAAAGSDADFPLLYGSLAVLFMIGLSFSVVTPLVVVVAAVLFGFVFLIMKYQFLYVYHIRIETGGAWWPSVFNLLTVGTIFFQVLNIAVLFVANSATSARRSLYDQSAYIAGTTEAMQRARDAGLQRQWAFVAPLPLITCVFWFAVTRYLAPKASPDAFEMDPEATASGSSSSSFPSSSLASKLSSLYASLASSDSVRSAKGRKDWTAGENPEVVAETEEVAGLWRESGGLDLSADKSADSVDFANSRAASALHDAAGADAYDLEDQVMNPAMVKPLPKVWVWKRSQHLLPAIMTPTYSSFEDFVHQNPHAAAAGPSDVPPATAVAAAVAAVRHYRRRQQWWMGHQVDDGRTVLLRRRKPVNTDGESTTLFEVDAATGGVGGGSGVPGDDDRSPGPRKERKVRVARSGQRLEMRWAKLWSEYEEAEEAEDDDEEDEGDEEEDDDRFGANAALYGGGVPRGGGGRGRVALSNGGDEDDDDDEYEGDDDGATGVFEEVERAVREEGLPPEEDETLQNMV
ncbi:hypothetical protein DFJ73DRAFT_263409 [Zopfochytrium polystomum]|nr:hypothetical protein DFJ73DRAFT_263409 [Zopfochytrium polystomum]